MLGFRTLFCAALISALPLLCSSAQTAPSSAKQNDPAKTCFRASPGSDLEEPVNLRSQNGVLKVSLTLRNSADTNGNLLYCYIDGQGNQSPTLRLHPGDTLALTLKNEISLPGSTANQAHAHKEDRASNSQSAKDVDSCAGSVMTAWTTNLHFHGMSVPPTCHQDDTLWTLLQPSSAPFEYRIQIPKNQPPGLYWYHPHIHGFSEDQILGGASGALIVEGIEQAKPQVAGLPERVLVVRDQKMPPVSPTQKSDANTPTKDLSINFIPVPYPKYPPAVIKTKPGERQFWRVLNASADTYLDLQIQFDGKRQIMNLVAIDGIPFKYDEENSRDAFISQTHLVLPPAARAEFVFSGPPAGVKATLVTNAVPRGPSDEYNPRIQLGAISDARIASGQDDNDPTRPLATIVASADATTPSSMPTASNASSLAPSLPSLASVRPVRTRTLFFSEELVDPKDPKSPTVFFITEQGQTPAAFDPKATAPNITVHQGDVEDWIIENRSQEPHDFHIHQTHFLLVGIRGVPYEEPTLRDTINLPPWEGKPHPYPYVKLRMDFRDPAIVGTFPYHCHILQHVDAGMMGTIRVEPAAQK
jgi:FtsP/CotA-like multicopper oxidase with cupredoxin domain